MFLTLHKMLTVFQKRVFDIREHFDENVYKAGNQSSQNTCEKGNLYYILYVDMRFGESQKTAHMLLSYKMYYSPMNTNTIQRAKSLRTTKLDSLPFWSSVQSLFSHTS